MTREAEEREPGNEVGIKQNRSPSIFFSRDITVFRLSPAVKKNKYFCVITFATSLY